MGLSPVNRQGGDTQQRKLKAHVPLQLAPRPHAHTGLSSPSQGADGHRAAGGPGLSSHVHRSGKQWEGASATGSPEAPPPRVPFF